ncbi:hypothetical protein GGD50_005800 [Rhizobium paranaense]|uniref:ParB/Sulfiredoxin domain-containing protein n=1 Tax=Rhizobium paranaense TaxID=1650438 RepID=A0A7W8XXE7_9HYPH|nr:hypothetical protein [Rhizobium paranaense]
MTSLNVRPELDAEGNETGIYRIPVGERRDRALERLVSQKRLAKTAGVPCIVSSSETLVVEDCLAENAQRVLHPLDQFRAFQTRRPAPPSRVSPPLISLNQPGHSAGRLLFRR